MLSPLLGARSAQPAAPTDLTPDTAQFDLDMEAAPTPGQEEQGEAQLDLRLRPQMDDQRELGDRAMLQQEGFAAQGMLEQTATTFLGRQIQSELQQRGRQRPQTLEQRISRIQQSLYNQLQQREAAEGDTAYQNVLEAMKSQAGDREQAEAADDAEQQQAEDQWAAELQLDQPTQEEMAKVEQAREQALRETFGEQTPDSDQDQSQQQAQGEPVPGVDQPLPGAGPNQPGSQQGGGGEQQGRTVEDILSQLDHEAPRLQSLAGQRENRVNRLLTEAEQQLNQGKYFAAERTYRQLLVDAPDRPMVRAGLMHAQLGAGMVRSAALNMRKLFNEHPELIAVRYGKQLLPPEKRLKWLQKELQRMIQKQQGVQPGMMLAYVGYQLESRQLVRYGLAAAESEKPRDPLLPVLRRIWLEGKDQAGADQQQQPNEPAQPQSQQGGSTSESSPPPQGQPKNK
jgi:hypothetical protein